MADKYEGWNLYNKVIIVGKAMTKWNRDTYRWETLEGLQQGYIVDPKNKKQFENAQCWAQTWRYDGNGKVIEKISGTVDTFDNDGFEIELMDSAEGSSQGGKLSFWNCKITKDGRTWVVGINADLLLRALCSCAWEKGKCLEPVMFARYKGGVGVLTKSSPEYQQAQADMQTKANMNKGKTTKYQLGHSYETITESDIYFGKIYCWYKPIYKQNDYHYYNSIIGFELLQKPIIKELLIGTKNWARNSKPETKASDIICADQISHDIGYKDKCPSRKEGTTVLEWDVTAEDIDKFLYKRFYHRNNWIKDAEKYTIEIPYFGYTTSPDKPLIFTEEQKTFFKEKCNILIKE